MIQWMIRAVSLAFFGVILAAPVAAEEATTIVVLVRHAEKASDGTRDPVLTPAGEARARALVDVLSETRIDHIITSPFRRTTLTATPLAEARGLTPQEVSVAAGLDWHIDAVVDAIRARSGDAVLVVGHSNTVPLIIHALGGPKLEALDESLYASLFTLVISPDEPVRMIHSHYGAPDEVPQEKAESSEE